MTNKEIKKYNQELAAINKEVNIGETMQLKERLERLCGGIKKLQNLADVVCATKYLGTALKFTEGQLKTASSTHSELCILPDNIDVCQRIYNELCHNIYCALQTEEMFNACVFAKWSCFCAAVAAIAACISVLLVLFCG
jgi:hypothetical protein